MYQKEIKIRYSEIGPDGRLGLAGILDYFQDASTFQSEQLGIGIEYLQKIRRAWLLAAWDVEIDRYPRFDERLTVFTIPYAFRGFYGFRNFGLLDENGTMIVRADSTWFWFDSEKGIPARLGDDIRQAYPLEEKIPMEYGSRKIQAPEDGKEMEPFAVRRYNLDTNGHVNNVQYVAMAMEYVVRGRKNAGGIPQSGGIWRSDLSVCHGTGREDHRPALQRSERAVCRHGIFREART